MIRASNPKTAFDTARESFTPPIHPHGAMVAGVTLLDELKQLPPLHST